MRLIELHGRPFIPPSEITTLGKLAGESLAAEFAHDPRALARIARKLPAELGMPDALLAPTASIAGPRWSPVPDPVRGSKLIIVGTDYTEPFMVRRPLAEAGIEKTVVRDEHGLRAALGNGSRAYGIVADEGVEEFARLVEPDGVFVNGAPHTVTSKIAQTELFQRDGVSIPPTRLGLNSADDVARAYEMLGTEVMLKDPLRNRGEGVLPAGSVDEAIKAWETLRAQSWQRADVFMQSRIDIPESDVRVHMARDPRTGLLQPISAVERSNPGSFRMNISQGGAARPIYRLDGSDPALSSDALREAAKAGDSVGLDWYGVDVATDLTTGKPVVFEIDQGAAPYESYMPAARAQWGGTHLVNLAMSGDGPAITAARRQTLA